MGTSHQSALAPLPNTQHWQAVSKATINSISVYSPSMRIRVLQTVGALPSAKSPSARRLVTGAI